VNPSQRSPDEAHTAWVATKKDGEILTAHCSCMAGLAFITDFFFNYVLILQFRRRLFMCGTNSIQGGISSEKWLYYSNIQIFSKKVSFNACGFILY
jgi:hypothetical protein